MPKAELIGSVKQELQIYFFTLILQKMNGFFDPQETVIDFVGAQEFSAD